MKTDIEDILRSGGGVIRRRDHPKLGRRLDRLLASKELTSILPGLLVRSADAAERDVRLRAGLLWLGPDAVVTGHAAARLTFWNDCQVKTISFAVPGGAPRAREDWPVMRTIVPEDMRTIALGVPVTIPAYTAMQLAAGSDGGDVIDRVLRSRQATLSSLQKALASMPCRAGNKTRARLLRDSRDAPWSELERKGHQLLRQHRITGWRTNAWVATAVGDTARIDRPIPAAVGVDPTSGASGAYADVLFEAERVIIEFDGWEFHSSRESFESDRHRRNELVLAGYTVLNFTWRQVVDQPEWVIGCVRRALGR